MLMQIRTKNAGHVFGYVTADAALLFRQTAAMNDAAAGGFRSCDAANF
jgi:hypothetical protein